MTRSENEVDLRRLSADGSSCSPPFSLAGLLCQVTLLCTSNLTLYCPHRDSEDIRHAIGVCKCLVSRDHHTFFRLYVNAPKMAGFVMDFFVVGPRASPPPEVFSLFL